MENVVVRTGTEAQNLIKNFIIDVNKGMAAAIADGYPAMRLPIKCTTQFTYIGELDAATTIDSQITPEVTETQTQINPEVVSTSRQDHSAARNTTRPASQRTTARQSGGDRDERTNLYGTGVPD